MFYYVVSEWLLFSAIWENKHMSRHVAPLEDIIAS